jgi:N-acetylmuramoyl-L-alanine amidase
MGFLLCLLLQQSIEDAVAPYHVKVEIDPVTSFHDISGGGRRLRVAPGMNAMVVDGQVTALREPAAIRDGKLILTAEITAHLKTLFAPKEAVEKPTAKKFKKTGKSGFKIVLDPGHGGMHTGGKSWSGKLVEKDVALDISKKLADQLEALGLDVVLTRETDKHFDEDVHADLQHRVDIAARQRADLFVSIHLNWSENKSARGFEVYVPRESRHRAECDRIAGFVHAEMMRRVDTNDRGIKEAGFYVLRNAPCTAVLVELEFLSNPQGERDMMSKDHRKKVVDILCDAIAKYARAKSN